MTATGLVAVDAALEAEPRVLPELAALIRDARASQLGARAEGPAR